MNGPKKLVLIGILAQILAIKVVCDFVTSSSDLSSINSNQTR